MSDCGALPSPFPASVRSIGICALCGISDPKRVKAGVARLESWGLTVCTDALQAPPDRFLAASDEVRAESLNRLLRRQDIDLILAARGGYGSARCLDGIDWEVLCERGIPVVGYSDMTAFHLAALEKGVRNCIFGPMLTGDFAREAASGADSCGLRTVFASLGDVLAGKTSKISLQPLQVGVARGPLVPTNLAVLCSLVGTPHLPSLAGCILVVEDINEAAYRVDRLLNQLLQAGVLEELGGLVFGQFTDCGDDEFLPDVFADFARHVHGPVAQGLQFGHQFPSLSFRVGVPSQLVVHDHAILEIVPCA